MATYSGNGDGRNRCCFNGAIVERTLANARYTVGNRDGGQAATTTERALANARHTVWNCDGGQAATILECPIANALYTIGNRDGGQAATTMKRSIPYRRNEIAIGIYLWDYNVRVGTASEPQNGAGLAARVNGVSQPDRTRGRNKGIRVGIFAYRANMRGVSILGFRSRGNSVDIFMPLRCDSLLFHKNFTANRAMLALGQPRFSARGSFCRIHHFGVAVGRDYLLLYKNFTANRAMLALGQPCFGAGSGEPAVDDFRVAVGRDDLLFYKHLMANRAMLALGQPCFGTGRSLGFVHHFGVAIGRDDILLYKHLIAD